jgi:hypothetical protein
LFGVPAAAAVISRSQKEFRAEATRVSSYHVFWLVEVFGDFGLTSDG